MTVKSTEYEFEGLKVNGNVYVNRQSSFGPLPNGTKINGQIIGILLFILALSISLITVYNEKHSVFRSFFCKDSEKI